MKALEAFTKAFAISEENRRLEEQKAKSELDDFIQRVRNNIEVAVSYGGFETTTPPSSQLVLKFAMEILRRDGFEVSGIYRDALVSGGHVFNIYWRDIKKEEKLSKKEKNKKKGWLSFVKDEK